MITPIHPFKYFSKVVYQFLLGTLTLLNICVKVQYLSKFYMTYTKFFIRYFVEDIIRTKQ